jgi:CBS domain containing-hemolysin-like protein
VIGIEVYLLLLLLFVVLDLSISAVRASLLNARPLRLLTLRERNPVRIERTLGLLQNPRLRASLRVGQVLMRLLLSALALGLTTHLPIVFPYILIAQVASLLLLAVLLLVGEFTVEGRILHDPEVWAVRMVDFGNLLVLLFTPLIALPLAIFRAQWMVEPTANVTEDELKTWVESEHVPGSLEREERQMIYSIFQFGDTLAREIMVPRVDMMALEVHTPLADAVQALLESGHSRVPVYERHDDNVIGLLYAKDLLRTMGGSGKKVSLKDLLRPAYFVPETKKADDLLAEMQSQRIHMALVVDEYGGVTGLVTLEDIIEEIIGEIRDEYDQGEESLYQQVSPDEYVFLGLVDLDDFNEVMGSHLPKSESDTLAGYLYDQMGRVPQGGESLHVDGLLLTIEQVSGRRIRRVRARREPPA